MQTNTKQTLLQWQDTSNANAERSATWYLVAGILTVSAIVYGVISGAWTMSVVVGLSAGLYFLVRNEEHPMHSIEINSLGIEFDGMFHPWTQWKNFWLLTDGTHTELHIAARRSLARDIKIFVNNVDPFEVRDTLLEFLPQVDTKREKLLDAFIRFTKL